MNSLSWSHFEPNLVIVGSMDMNCYLMQISDDRKSIDVIKTFKHPKKVFGVRWNPFDKKQFATCCEDGIVRVFTTDNTTALH